MVKLSKKDLATITGLSLSAIDLYLCRPEFSSKYDEDERRYLIDCEFVNNLEELLNLKKQKRNSITVDVESAVNLLNAIVWGAE